MRLCADACVCSHCCDQFLSSVPSKRIRFKMYDLSFALCWLSQSPMSPPHCAARQAFRGGLSEHAVQSCCIAAARALAPPRLGVRGSRSDTLGGIVERASVPSTSNEKTDQRRQSSKRAAERSKDRGVRSGQLAAEQHSQRPLRERTDTLTVGSRAKRQHSE